MKEKILALLRLVAQVALLILFNELGGFAARRMGLPLPGSVVGLALLLLCFALRILPMGWLEAGSRLVLGEMLLFFIPAIIGVMQYFDVLRRFGVRYLTGVALATLVVMLATGLAAEGAARLRRRPE